MKNICVYCGSSPGKHAEYIESARVLARELVNRNIGLIYGGVSVGIMGEIADTVIDCGGEVIGVIPKTFVDKKISHNGLSELRIVDSMHERKAIMAEAADGFVALPGGLGTLEELFEVLTWSQLGFHKKPCGLLNVKGYYDNLALFFDHAVEEQFIKNSCRKNLLIEDTPKKLLNLMSTYKLSVADK